MRKLAVLCLALILVVVPVQAAVFEENEIQAIGAVLMDARTGRVLWGKNEHAPLAMASTTKIMTAIAALENGDIESKVVASRRAAMAPKVHMGLSAGEEFRLYDLLLALMLESSNDAAIAIAEHISGSMEDFCVLMTHKAREIGADNTVFETPSGLDAENHLSTAYDMALITRYALENEEFMRLINTRSAEFRSSRRVYHMNNKNRLLNEFEGANGVKTGFTGKAGQCFVGACKRGDMQLISVVLGSGWGAEGREQKWKDTKKILTHGFDNFKYEVIIAPQGDSGDIYVERSKTLFIPTYFAHGLMLPLSREEYESIVIDSDAPRLLRAPIIDGQRMGTAKVFIMGELAQEIPILANGTAARHDLKTSLERVLNTWLEMGTNEKVDTLLPEF